MKDIGFWLEDENEKFSDEVELKIVMIREFEDKFRFKGEIYFVEVWIFGIEVFKFN